MVRRVPMNRMSEGRGRWRHGSIYRLTSMCIDRRGISEFYIEPGQ